MLSQIDQCLQKQCRFSDTGIAADQDDPAGHKPSAQYAVELIDTRFETGNVYCVDIGKGQDRCHLCNSLTVG